MTRREHEIGILALAQHAAKQKVLDWISEESRHRRSAAASQSPHWNEYQRAVQAFETALSTASPDEWQDDRHTDGDREETEETQESPADGAESSAAPAADMQDQGRMTAACGDDAVPESQDIISSPGRESRY